MLSGMDRNSYVGSERRIPESKLRPSGGSGGRFCDRVIFGGSVSYFLIGIGSLRFGLAEKRRSDDMSSLRGGCH